MLTFGSLFAGIGGFDLGFERAGMKCRWQVEIDPYCREVLTKHWPDVRRWTDVRTFMGLGVHSEHPKDWRVDVICGGFPCQDISDAGRREGIDGEQSGLFREFMRVVRTLRPKYIVLENVAALLARGMGTVLGELAESGFDAEWDCIPAAALGAPHIRDRIFIVAYAAGVGRGAGWSRRFDSGDPGEPEQALPVSDADCQPLVWTSKPRAQCPAWDHEPAVPRVLDGVPARLVEDRNRALGNSLIPQIAEWIGRRIIEWEKGNVQDEKQRVSGDGGAVRNANHPRHAGEAVGGV